MCSVSRLVLHGLNVPFLNSIQPPSDAFPSDRLYTRRVVLPSHFVPPNFFADLEADLLSNADNEADLSLISSGALRRRFLITPFVERGVGDTLSIIAIVASCLAISLIGILFYRLRHVLMLLAVA